MENVILGMTQLFQPVNLITLVIGVVIGLVVGALPGLNDSITMAVLVPVTFGMSPSIAMCLLVGIYCSACYGGSIPAILLRIPGTASSVLTLEDGYPMTQQGKAGFALSLSTISSVFGGVFSSIVLICLSPFLAKQALRFGPPEYFALGLMGLTAVVGLTKKHFWESILSLGIGLLIACMGMSPQTGFSRFTFGTPYLMQGIPMMPMLIGLFGITTLLDLLGKPKGLSINANDVKAIDKESLKVQFVDAVMAKRLLPTWIKSALIGCAIGILPGTGMLMAIYLAYNEAIRAYPDKKFGTGIPEGVASVETANNAVVAGSMVPLLSLGVPGNATSAIFVGALMIHGLRPGPALFADSPQIAYLILCGFLAANIIMLPLGLLFCKFLATFVLRLKREILNGIIIVLCLTGSFAIGNSMFYVMITLLFGAIGFIFSKVDIPQAPMILAIILGPMIESNFLRSMVYGDNIFMVFMQRPICIALLALAAFFVLRPLIASFKSIGKQKKAA